MSKKIGRNDPCPCGSGLKYKKCCIDKTDDMEFSNPMKKLITHLRFKRNMDAKKRQYSLDSVNIMIAEDGVAVFLMPDDNSAFPLSFLFQAYHSFARRSSFCHIGHLLFI